MGCLLWGFGRKLTALQQHHTVQCNSIAYITTTEKCRRFYSCGSHSQVINENLLWLVRHHGEDRISVLLALCAGNPWVTCDFPAQGTTNTELSWFLCCWLCQAFERTAEWPVKWDTLMLMWLMWEKIITIYLALTMLCLLCLVSSYHPFLVYPEYFIRSLAWDDPRLPDHF